MYCFKKSDPKIKHAVYDKLAQSQKSVQKKSRTLEKASKYAISYT